MNVSVVTDKRWGKLVKFSSHVNFGKVLSNEKKKKQDKRAYIVVRGN